MTWAAAPPAKAGARRTTNLVAFCKSGEWFNVLARSFAANLSSIEASDSIIALAQ
jgi:hypothetical protein